MHTLATFFILSTQIKTYISLYYMVENKKPSCR